MSLFATPEAFVAAAADLANIGSAVNEAHATAASVTKGLTAAAQDEVSAAVVEFFDTHAQEYQALAMQVAKFHQRFAQAVAASAESYLAAEKANVTALIQNSRQDLVAAINAPAEKLLGHPLIGSGTGSSVAVRAVAGHTSSNDGR